MRKYSFTQNERGNIFTAYNEFTSLYDGDRYFSKREYPYWLKDHECLKSIIFSYKYHIDGLTKIAYSIESLSGVIQS